MKSNIIVRNMDNEQLDIKFSTFPAGERYCMITKGITDIQNAFYTFSLLTASSDGIMDLILVSDVIRRCHKDKPILNLNLTYAPYSRQDKVHKKGESLSFEVIMNLFETYFDHIKILDVHNPNFFSYESSKIELIQPDYSNFFSVFNLWGIDYTHFDSIDSGVICIDKGSRERAKTAADFYGLDILHNLDKTRIDGKIEYSCDNMDIPKNIKNIVIFDDIIDGGIS